ncbi:MAG: hypothetical protein JWM44_3789 [Bacilli bacterium]|nr:hypothetical protein [Bacilli bacterium]
MHLNDALDAIIKGVRAHMSYAIITQKLGTRYILLYLPKSIAKLQRDSIYNDSSQKYCE